MKKISLKEIINGLKRDEMRSISGGCGFGSNKTCTACTKTSDCPGSACATDAPTCPQGRYCL